MCPLRDDCPGGPPLRAARLALPDQVLPSVRAICSRRRAATVGTGFTVAVSLLGETLKIRREELGLGQEQVAEQLGVSQQTVSRWEHGTALPRPARVVSLARLLDVDSGHLHRLAGYLPEDEQSDLAGPFHEVYAGMARLSRSELVLLLDRAWQEMRRREGLAPPGTS